MVKVSAKHTPRSVNRGHIQNLARAFVESQISKQLDQDGKDACILIGHLLSRCLVYYHTYYQQVGHMVIEVNDIVPLIGQAEADRFSKSQWALLEADVMREASRMQSEIDKHIQYLQKSAEAMDRMGPNAQAYLQQLLDFLGDMATPLPPAEPTEAELQARDAEALRHLQQRGLLTTSRAAEVQKRLDKRGGV